MRAVQEFYCVNGRCREVQLADGTRSPVRLSVEQIPQGLDTCGTVISAALRIEYLGHRKALLALGCISRDALASARCDRHEDDPRGGVFRLTNNADLRRRGTLKVTYIAQTRAFAAMLPGVRSYCADWLETLTGRPRLRLVVDNTRQ